MFAMSATAHFGNAKSAWMHDTLWTLDQVGVALAICGGGFGLGYFTLVCSAFEQALFVAFTAALLFGIVAAILFVYPPGEAAIPLAVCAVVSWGTSIIMTIFKLNGVDSPDVQLGFHYVVLAAGITLTGFVFFITRIPGNIAVLGFEIHIVVTLTLSFFRPERWLPGYFDYFLSSHNLWHISLIFAANTYWHGLTFFYSGMVTMRSQCR